MARPIQASQFAESPVPSVSNRPIVAAQTFKKGAPLTLNAGEVQEHAGGATVTGLYGFSLFGCAAGVPAFGSTMGVVKANRVSVFAGEFLTGGAGGTVVTDLSAINVGDRYGLIKSTPGDWYIDLDDTTNVVLEIVDKSEELNLGFFKVIESALDQP